MNELFERGWKVYLDYMTEIGKMDMSAGWESRLEEKRNAWSDMVAEISQSGHTDEWNSYSEKKTQEMGDKAWWRD